MPEGDTIAWAAKRMRPVLVYAGADALETPPPRHARARWPERLRDRAVRAVDTHGKNLLIRFDGDLVLYSHLRLTGAWGVYGPGKPWRQKPHRACLVLRARDHDVVQFGGPVLELMTSG